MSGVQHRRSIDLTAPRKPTPGDAEFNNLLEPIPDYSATSRELRKMTEEELLRYGEYLRSQVDAGHAMWQFKLGEARAEWIRRHPRSRKF